jgi:hypothetical protein
MSLIEDLSSKHQNCKLVSQHTADIKTAEECHVQTLQPAEFFNQENPLALIKP